MAITDPVVLSASSRRFVTLSRKDAEFQTYLDGSFSRDEVALPLKSLNVGTVSEEVTFAVVDAKSVSQPPGFLIARALLRPSTLIFSTGPMVAVTMKSLAQGFHLQPGLVLGAFLSVLLFHSAVNLFNDYGDHMKGQDRVRPHGGSRAIQKGWVRAWQVKRSAWALTLAAAIAGIPAVISAPSVIIAGLALLVGLEFAFQRIRLKARGWAEVVAFALTGPLLSSGFAWAINGEWSLSDATLGCVFGAIALMYFHSVNFENIMPDSQAGARTWATRTGFDASQTFFVFTCALTLMASVIHVFVMEQDFRLFPLALAQAMALIPMLVRVRSLQSPVSSGLVGLRWEPVRLAWISAFALAGGYAWIINVRPH